MINLIINEKEQIETKDAIRVFAKVMEQNNKPYIVYPEGEKVSILQFCAFLDNQSIETESVLVLNLELIDYFKDVQDYNMFTKSLMLFMKEQPEMNVFMFNSIKDRTHLLNIAGIDGLSLIYLSSYIWRLYIENNDYILSNIKSKEEELYNKYIKFSIDDFGTVRYDYDDNEVYQNMKKYMF